MERNIRKSKPSTSQSKITSFFFGDMDVDSDPDNENSSENLKQIVTNLVKYFIANSSTKIPLKRADFVRNLRIPQNLINHAIEAAQRELNDIYGLNIKEAVEFKSGKAYLVYSTIKLASSAILNHEAAADLKTLFIILSYIFMKTGEVQEINLKNFLEKLRFDNDEIKKSIDKYVKQMYLRQRKINMEGQNDIILYYSWGERASLEFDKKAMLEQVSRMLKKPSSAFPVPHKEVYGDD